MRPFSRGDKNKLVLKPVHLHDCTWRRAHARRRLRHVQRNDALDRLSHFAIAVVTVTAICVSTQHTPAHSSSDYATIASILPNHHQLVARLIQTSREHPDGTNIHLVHIFARSVQENAAGTGADGLFKVLHEPLNLNSMSHMESTCSAR